MLLIDRYIDYDARPTVSMVTRRVRCDRCGTVAAVPGVPGEGGWALPAGWSHYLEGRMERDACGGCGVAVPVRAGEGR